MTEATEPVLSQSDGLVRRLILNRPSRLNAFTAGSYRSLVRLLEQADHDPGTHVVLLEGAGRAFSSGVDLREMAGTEEAVHELGESFNALVEALLSLTKPLVAAVQGPAVGFGATILLHCDIVLLSDDARLRFPFTALGTAPEAGSTVLLPSIVGPQLAAEVLFTSRWIGPDEAVATGMALRSIPRDRLESVARQFAGHIAEQEPAAMASVKRLLRAGRTEAVREAMSRERDEARVLKEALGTIGKRASKSN